MKESPRRTKSELMEENSLLKQRLRQFEHYRFKRGQNDEHLNHTLQQLRSHIDNSPLAAVEFDLEYRVIYWSRTAERVFGWRPDEILGRRIDEMKWVHEDDVNRVKKLSEDMFLGRNRSNIHTNRNYRKDGSVIICEWYNSALLNPRGELVSVFSSVLDITERKRTDEERERLILELQEAVGKVKTLSGMLPICASCKKIRDDKGYWEQIEIYISSHSEAEFSHGICPECAEKLYPRFYRKKKEHEGPN